VKDITLAVATAAALTSPVSAQEKVEQFRLSGVTLRESTYQGAQAFELTMPPSSWQDPAREKLSDRNFMAWLPLDFGNGTIDVEVASDLASDAPAYARGFIGLAYRIDAQGRFENIYLRPTNSTAPDQVRRNHTVQYAAYPDFRFDMLRAQFPKKYESHAHIATGRWIYMRLVEGSTAQPYLDHAPRPAFIVNDMKLPSDQRGGVGIWIESGTVAHFRNLRVKSGK
jgi:hypothetical protein